MRTAGWLADEMKHKTMKNCPICGEKRNFEVELNRLLFLCF